MLLICLLFFLVFLSSTLRVDSEKRRIYDQSGEQGIKEMGSGGGFHSPMDIFNMFFGGGPSKSHGKFGRGTAC